MRLGRCALCDDRKYIASRRGVGIEQQVAQLRSAAASLRKPVLLDEFLVVPVAKLRRSAAKYEVSLREEPLQASRAIHTILTRMVMFHCDSCRERFPTFHPAYEPPEELELDILKAGFDGVASCSTAVASWNDLPPPPDAPEPELLVATVHTGLCKRCQRDMTQESKKNKDKVARRSHLNVMDPCWNFPHKELQWLFEQATVVEEQLIALEHMQVNFVQVYRTGMTKFRRNVISFPQDIGAFAQRWGLGKTYRKDDRVNCFLRPGDDPARERVLSATATALEKEALAVSEEGALVFPATVTAVRQDGVFELKYDLPVGGVGCATLKDLRPRVRMPWHPTFLNGQFALFLHRNVPHGRDIEDVRVRWDYVSNYLKALTRLGRWRTDCVEPGPVDVGPDENWRQMDGVGPMHCWYDPGLFDVADEVEELRRQYAPQVWQGEYVSQERAEQLRCDGDKSVKGCDVRTAEDFRQAGFVVQVLGEVEGAPGDGDVTKVDGALFERWLELEPMRYARLVCGWWKEQGEATEGGIAGMKVANEEAAVDLLTRIARDSRRGGGDGAGGAAGVVAADASGDPVTATGEESGGC